MLLQPVCRCAYKIIVTGKYDVSVIVIQCRKNFSLLLDGVFQNNIASIIQSILNSFSRPEIASTEKPDMKRG